MGTGTFAVSTGSLAIATGTRTADGGSFGITSGGEQFVTMSVGANGAIVSPPAVSTSSNRRWLPKQEVPIIGDDGKVHPVWYRFFDEVFNVRLGGINGPKLGEVSANAISAVTQSIAANTIASQAQKLATNATAAVNTNADAQNALRQVNINAGIAGASSTPTASRVPV